MKLPQNPFHSSRISFPSLLCPALPPSRPPPLLSASSPTIVGRYTALELLPPANRGKGNSERAGNASARPRHRDSFVWKLPGNPVSFSRRKREGESEERGESRRDYFGANYRAGEYLNREGLIPVRRIISPGAPPPAPLPAAQSLAVTVRPGRAHVVI